MHSVTLSNLKTFNAEPDLSILDNGLKQGIFLEHSCKTGRCGVCAVKVNNGSTCTIQAETGLTKEQAESGYVLSCCRTAASDIGLETEDLPELQNIKIKTYPARIESVETSNESIVKVVLRTPPSTPMAFLPGQYIGVIGPNGIRRSYSIANAPRADHKVELHIKKVDGGELSRYWFEQAKVNDLLRFEGPLGTFFLRSPMPAKLLLLATGTGFAPIKAMLEQLKARATQAPEALGTIELYWGNRFEADIYQQLDLLEMPNLKVHTVVSRPGPGWPGRTGHIQNAVAEDHSNLKDFAVYACGSIHMIESAKAMLTAIGLPSNKFYSDAFVSS